MMSLQSMVVFDLVNRPWRYQKMSQGRLYECQELMREHWNRLKTSSLGSLSRVMWSAEAAFIRYSRQYGQCKLNATKEEMENLITRNISILFCGLARAFEAKNLLGFIVPVDEKTYKTLSEPFDEAFTTLMRGGIYPYMQPEDRPNLFPYEECRLWLRKHYLQFSRITTLDLSACGLKVIPREIHLLIGLQKLLLADNNIQQVPCNLGYLSSLTHISFQNNIISHVSKALGILYDLTFLNLGSNRLSQFPHWLPNLPLKKLYLHNNQIPSIPCSIGQMQELKELVLFNNNLETCPNELCELSQLQKLLLNENSIGEIPEQIGELVTLKVLDLKNNQLTALPDSIGDLTNLRNFHLENNWLSSLPGTFIQLTRLETLSIQNNYLEAIPERLGQLTLLRDLNLKNNLITFLPSSIGNLKNLDTLHLKNNFINRFPASFTKLTSLKTLLAQKNRIRNLPEEIGHSPP